MRGTVQPAGWSEVLGRSCRALQRHAYHQLVSGDLFITAPHSAAVLRSVQADIQMHSYQNGTSERCKRDNWEQIKRVCQKNELSIPSNVIEGTIHGEPGAAVSLMELLYEKFTGKK